MYAGSRGSPFTESSEAVPPRAVRPRQAAVERLFTSFADHTGTPLLVGRLANLYGPDQDIAKLQGLVSLLCDALVRRQEMSVYVSLDTLRDYLFADDAASMVCTGLDCVAERGGVHLKVLASGSALSIAQVIGEVTRLARRRPPVRMGTSQAASFQVRDLRLRSEAWPDLGHLVRTPIGVGIAACLENAAANLRRPVFVSSDGDS